MDLKKLRTIVQKIEFLSFLAMGRTSPNPPVAAVLTDPVGNILATGNTQVAGYNHAERELFKNFDEKILNQTLDQNSHQNPHQLYVSLEPCTHYGKTPPCKDLILERKPSQLVLGWKDPNPLVKTGEWEDYKQSGIDTKLHPVLARSSLPFLHGFFQRIKKDRPWIWIKSAISKDGYYATQEEKSSTISSLGSSYYLQMLRAKFDAVVVGPKTLSIDSPSLNFRLEDLMFSQRGIVKKVNQNPVADFFSPGEHLLDILLAKSQEEVFEEHIQNLYSYQPWRVFILQEGMILRPKFIEKQKSINETYGNKKCLFYLLQTEENSAINTDSFEENISLLSDSPVTGIQFGKSDLFLKNLTEHGINTVLFEAGSFLWEFIKENLDVNDCILSIQNSKSLGKGKLFSGFDQFEKQIHYQVGEDLWQLEMKT